MITSYSPSLLSCLGQLSVLVDIILKRDQPQLLLNCLHAKAIKVMKFLLGLSDSGCMSALRRPTSENSAVKQSSATKVINLGK